MNVMPLEDIVTKGAGFTILYSVKICVVLLVTKELNTWRNCETLRLYPTNWTCTEVNNLLQKRYNNGNNTVYVQQEIFAVRR